MKYNNIEIATMFMEFIGGKEYHDHKRTIRRLILSDKLSWDEEHYHNAVTKVYDLFCRRGFKFDRGIKYSGYSFIGYLIQSVKNEIIINKNKSKKNISIDDCVGDDENDNIEHNLPPSLIIDQQEQDEKVRMHIEEDALITSIFNYVDNKYPPLESGFFKFYFKTKYSYAKLSEMCDFSIAKIHKNVTAISQDVKRQFDFDIKAWRKDHDLKD